MFFMHKEIKMFLTRTLNLKHLLILPFSIILFIQFIQFLPICLAGRPPPAPVTINKCCRIGEYLDSTKNCIAGSSLKWVPSVFLIGRKNYFEPRGELPRFFRIQENQFPKTCINYQLFTGPNNVIIFSNGSLHLYEKSIFIDPIDYCADKESALVCLTSSPNSIIVNQQNNNENNQIDSTSILIDSKKYATKLKKCCGRKFIYNNDDKTCVIYPTIKDNNNNNNNNLQQHGINNITTTMNLDIIYGFPDCSDYAIVGVFQNEFLNIENGNLTLESGKIIQTNDYCLEHTITDQILNQNQQNVIFDKSNFNIFTCSVYFSKPSEHQIPRIETNNRKIVISIGLFISVIFLSATLATGLLMPSNHHVLHWKCQVYYVSCLLVGDLLLAITLISQNSIRGAPCIMIAIIMHFFFLAAFFWLNTMCFNIWWTFRDFRPTSLEKNQEVFRLRIYSAYAWGVPLIIASVAAILDLFPHGLDDNYLRPRFGEPECWFYGDMEILTYFFGPVGILLCINLLLFASTARQLTCGLWKLDDVKSTTERAALGRVCLKLVIVMGVTWVADIISWLVRKPAYLWYFTDLINAMQGVFIFIVVGCQPQVWSAIKRIWTSKTGRNVTANTQGPQHSSSSHGLPSIGETITNNTLTNTTSTKVPMETVC